MSRDAKEIIDDMRHIVKPFLAAYLKRTNYENMGDTDKAEFETEFEAVLTLAENAVDAAINPQKMRGKWVEVNDYYNRISGKCSVCGWESHMYEDDVVGMNFCPNCGCQMNGDEEDEQ